LRQVSCLMLFEPGRHGERNVAAIQKDHIGG
jgi:hypothetical protein